MEGNIPSFEENFGLNGEFTDLGKTFHIDGGEVFIQASSDRVQTRHKAIWF